jgi:hypothetical protein
MTTFTLFTYLLLGALAYGGHIQASRLQNERICELLYHAVSHLTQLITAGPAKKKNRYETGY